LSPVSARTFLSLTLEARRPTAAVGSTVRPRVPIRLDLRLGASAITSATDTISGDRRNRGRSRPCRGDLLALLPRAVSSGDGRRPASRGRRSGLMEGFTIRCSQTGERTLWRTQRAQRSRPGAPDASPSGAGAGVATPLSALAERPRTVGRRLVSRGPSMRQASEALSRRWSALFAEADQGPLAPLGGSPYFR
jgi:hypothetical protein